MTRTRPREPARRRWLEEVAAVTGSTGLPVVCFQGMSWESVCSTVVLLLIREWTLSRRPRLAC
ncbi:hypothetical protein ACOBQX_24440 [Actinokineospora sp. G85]|uniref:hypothetical protein n=1 Tax=Actinokineospora sp. G85 TaxID=3406626 RepID=UPI003C760292